MKKLFMSALVEVFVPVTTSGPGFGEKVAGDASAGTGYPDYNGVAGTTLTAARAYGFAGITTARAFLRFYLQSIPANATSLSATLSLFYWSTDISSTPPNDNFAILYVASWGWDELALTWNNQPGFPAAIGSKSYSSWYFSSTDRLGSSG
jgi:hypothetical protein